MSQFYLSIGSNIEPQRNIPSAIQWIRKNFRRRKISSVYETEPSGPAGQPKFWNLAVLFESDLDSKMLKTKLRRFEKKLGRIRKAGNRFAPRTIDLDLLPETLTPAHRREDFIMIPLAEISPRAVDKTTRKTYRAIASPLKSKRIRKIFTP